MMHQIMSSFLKGRKGSLETGLLGTGIWGSKLCGVILQEVVTPSEPQFLSISTKTG